MIGEQAIFNLEIKKKSGLSLNPDIHHSKVFSPGNIFQDNSLIRTLWISLPLYILMDMSFKIYPGIILNGSFIFYNWIFVDIFHIIFLNFYIISFLDIPSMHLCWYLCHIKPLNYFRFKKKLFLDISLVLYP